MNQFKTIVTQCSSTSEHSLERYSVIPSKLPREIVMLRAHGCAWKKCRFCDYHLDYSKDEEANYQLNKSVLDKVSGQYHHLEVINSGSFVDLDDQTMQTIHNLCKEKSITTLHFECHWMHREAIPFLRIFFAGLPLKIKVLIGVETFDATFRDSYLSKGIDCDSPPKIASYFDEVCLLQGIPGQSISSMIEDIEIGLTYFERVFVNIMTSK